MCLQVCFQFSLQFKSVPCNVVVKTTQFLLFFYAADEASLYMLGGCDVQLYEVKAFDEDFHSWFIGQTVQKGWSHYIVNSKVM